MLRKIIYVVSVILLALVITLFYQRLNDKPVTQTDNKIYQLIPSDASFLISSDQILSLTNELQNQNLVWKNLIKADLFKDVSEAIVTLDSLFGEDLQLKAGLNNTQVLVSFQKEGKSKLVPLVVVTMKNGFPEGRLKSFVGRLSSQKLQEKKYDNILINYASDSSGFTAYYIHKNYFVWSKSQLVLERSARELSGKAGLSLHKGFSELNLTQRSNALATLYVNVDDLKHVLSKQSSEAFLKKMNILTGVNSWLGMDVALQSKKLSLMGFCALEADNYMSAFHGQDPLTMDAIDVIPVGAQQFTAINISDLNKFRKAYKTYLGAHNKLEAYYIWLDKTGELMGQNPELFADDFFSGEFIKVSYAGSMGDEHIAYLLAKVKSKSLAEQALHAKLKVYAEKKRKKTERFIDEINIDKELVFKCYEYEPSEFIGLLYGDVLKSDRFKYFGFYDNYLIAAPNKKVLKDILYANVLGKTLSRQSYFEELYENFTNTFNLFWYQDCRSVPETNEGIWSEYFYSALPGNKEVFSELNGMGFQMAAFDKFPYVNFTIDYSGEQKSDAETIWQSLLDTAFVMKPALVKNHYTGENEIFIQDLNNKIYLISPSGRILWEKVLNEPILSDIYQVDAYKNNKLQLLFNTRSKLYLLDRNGNYVERFPVNFPSKATTGLGLADYEKTKNYRIFIPTDDKRILLYAVDGNRVKGWRFDKSDHKVSSPVQHMRFGKKDYIVFADEKRVYLLDRQGRTRVNLSEQFSKNRSTNFYKVSSDGGTREILTADNNGNLLSILLSGAVTKRKLPVSSENYMLEIANINGSGLVEVIVIEGKSMKVMDVRGNVLFEKAFERDILDKPNVYQFSTNDYRIGVIDRQSEKIYLFDNKGKEKAGFPLEGNTPFSIGFLKSSTSSFNLIVGGRDNYLYNYIVK